MRLLFFIQAHYSETCRKNCPKWYTPPAVKKKPKHVRLTDAQARSWITFNYYSFENPKLTFEQVASKVLGRNPFPRTPRGRKFEQECHKIFDRAREG